jgi:peptidoglycan/LPS O-acetylase OafA/YrhL
MQERYYRPELDILRLMAFLLVFFTHRMDLASISRIDHPWRHNLSLVGVFGVPVFFLLSAFLITELLTREEQQTGEVHLKAFYVRRILRIWPLYFAALFTLSALTHFIPKVGLTRPDALLAFVLFAGNWFIWVHGWFSQYPINPFWSISVEEQFYIVIPLIVRYARRRGLAIICLVLLAIAYVMIYRYGHPPFNGTKQWTNSFVQFQFFAAGSLLSLGLRGRLPRMPLLARAATLMAGIGCWLIALLRFGVEADFPHPASAAGSIAGWLLVLLGTVLLLLGLLGTPSRYLPKPLVYLGRISYGMYIVHAFVLTMVFTVERKRVIAMCESLNLGYWWKGVGTVIALTVTILIASLSYRYFEAPFLRLKKRFTFVPSRD